MELFHLILGEKSPIFSFLSSLELGAKISEPRNINLVRDFGVVADIGNFAKAPKTQRNELRCSNAFGLERQLSNTHGRILQFKDLNLFLKHI